MSMFVKCQSCHNDYLIFSLKYCAYLDKDVCRDCVKKYSVLYKKGKQSITINNNLSLRNGFLKINKGHKSTDVQIFELRDSCIGMKDKTLKCLVWLIGA